MAINNRPFKYALGTNVVLKNSEESGSIIGRAEYEDVSNQYLVRYKAADGRLTETWWAESAIAHTL